MAEVIADSARYESNKDTNKIMDLNGDTLRDISSFPDSDRTQESTTPTVEVKKKLTMQVFCFFFIKSLLFLKLNTMKVFLLFHCAMNDEFKVLHISKFCSHRYKNNCNILNSCVVSNIYCLKSNN